MCSGCGSHMGIPLGAPVKCCLSETLWHVMLGLCQAEHLDLYFTHCVLLFGKAGGCGSHQQAVKPTARNIEARAQTAVQVLRCPGLRVLDHPLLC
jgi:hypothetical protein